MASLKLMSPRGPVLFLHVPKTGGVWVDEALKSVRIRDTTFDCKPWEWAHGTWDQCQDGTEWVFTFGFKREKESWYRSVWRYTRENDGPVVCSSFRGPVLDYGLPYDEWRASVPGEWWEDMHSQFLDHVDFVGDFADLGEELIRALTVAGFEFDPECIRKKMSKRVNGTTNVEAPLTA